MKTHILLITILCFSSPLIIEAEIENRVAKRDAQRDAKIENQLGWLAGGCLGSMLPWATFLALLTAEAEGIIHYQTVYDFELCFLSGIVLGALLPTAYAIFRSPVPPAERLLGKSPDYVNTYIATYKKQVKEQRILLSATGCVVGTTISYTAFIRFAAAYFISGNYE